MCIIKKLNIAVLLIACLLTSLAKAEVDYLPGVMIGSEKANALLVFIWSPTCRRCAQSYSEIIHPLLDADVKAKKLLVFLAQVTDGSEIDLETGVILYCARREKYGEYIKEYLRSYAEPITTVGKRKVQATAVRLAPLFALPSNLRACLDGKAGSERRRIIAQHTKEVFSLYKDQELPLLVFNSQVVRVSSVDEIRSMLSKIK